MNYSMTCCTTVFGRVEQINNWILHMHGSSRALTRVTPTLSALSLGFTAVFLLQDLLSKTPLVFIRIKSVLASFSLSDLPVEFRCASLTSSVYGSM